MYFHVLGQVSLNIGYECPTGLAPHRDKALQYPIEIFI